MEITSSQPVTTIWNKTLAVWLARLLLAVLLLLGSEILLWIDPPNRTFSDWLLLIPGYIALATLTLDLAVRYRVRSIYEVMTLIALYGSLNALLLNPQTSFDDFPRTLVTRIVGAHTLLGIEMFALWLTLTGGRHARQYWLRVLGFSLWVGFYWGIWCRWAPSLINWAQAEAELSTMFLYAGALFALAIILLLLCTRNKTPSPPDLRLSPAGFGVLIILLIVLLLVGVTQEAISNTSAIPIMIGLVVGCGAILWFRRTRKGAILLDAHVPVHSPAWGWLLVMVAVFVVSTVFAYQLPLLNILGYNQLSLMEFGFAAVGFLWFPIIAVVIGGRAFDRQSSRLDF